MISHASHPSHPSRLADHFAVVGSTGPALLNTTSSAKAAAFWDDHYIKNVQDEWILAISPALLATVTASIPPSATPPTLLEIGCGTSTLASSLLPLLPSLSTILATDISSQCISALTVRDSVLAPNLSYATLDVLTSLAPPLYNNFSAILDKGCLDTFLFRYPKTATLNNKSLLHTLFDNIHSSLSPAGVYLVISPRKKIPQLRDYNGFQTVQRIKANTGDYELGALDGDAASSAYIYVCTRNPAYTPTPTAALAFSVPPPPPATCPTCLVTRGDKFTSNYNDRKWLNHVKHCSPPACLCCAVPTTAPHTLEHAVHTYDLGSFTIHQLTDTAATCDFKWMFPDHPNLPTTPAVIAYGCALLVTPQHKILLDSSIGPETGPPSSNVINDVVMTQTRPLTSLPSLLSSLNILPSAITHVVHSHLHRDHTHWNVVDGVPFFANAQHVVQRAEIDYWGSTEALRKHSNYDGAIKPLLDEGMVRVVDGDATIVGQVTVKLAAGHTPGHMITEIGDAATFVGDLVHQREQVEHRDWVPRFDWNAELAVRSRIDVLNDIEQENKFLISPHFATPGVGRVEEGRFRFAVPAGQQEQQQQQQQQQQTDPEDIDANDPIAFWGAWSEAHCKEGEKCSCFEGLGSVM